MFVGGCEDEREREQAGPPAGLVVKLCGSGVGGRWERRAPGKNRKKGKEDGDERGVRIWEECVSNQ